MMRILVTGATGFVGRHLVELLLLSSKGSVYGTYLSTPGEWKRNAILIQCDLRQAKGVAKLLKEIRPQQIYHLGAQSSPLESSEQAREVYETNFWGTHNLLEAARQAVPKATILIVGSGQCYGERKAGKGRAVETQPLLPPNAYALSKAAADMLGAQYHFRFGMQVIRARPFNHTGPGQQAGFVCSDYARRIAAIEMGREPPVIRVRDIMAKRDFSDVRDVVRAYEILVKKGKPGEAYNIASGQSISVRQIVTVLASFSSRLVRIYHERQPLRSGDVSRLYGSSRKLRRTTGWKPVYNMRQTLRDLFEYWKILLAQNR